MRSTLPGVWTSAALGAVCFVAQATSLAAAEAEIAKPAAIQTQDVPPIPAKFVERLRQYQNTRSANFAGWSPDGQGILVRTQFANAPQLHRVYEPGGRREQVTFFDEPVSGRFIPQAQDGAIVLEMSRGGSENDQLYLLDRASHTTTLLTDGKSKHRLDVIRNDGKLMVLGGNGRNGRDTDLFLADPRQPGILKTLLEANNEYWTVQDWSHDGNSLALTRYVSINESYPAVLDLLSGKRRDLPLRNPPPAFGPQTEAPPPKNEKVAIGEFKFRHNGQGAYITSDLNSEFKRLWTLDLEEGRYVLVPIGNHSWDIDALEVDHVSGRVAFTLNADGVSRLFLLEYRGDRYPAVLEQTIPTGIVSSLRFSPDGKHLGFTLARPDAPADVYSIDIATRELTRWTYSEVGGLNSAMFVTAERIRFPSFDEREIPGWYFRPRGASREKPAPVLINIHGGPESQSQPQFSGVTQFFLNEMGMAVIYPNVRGSAGYGKTYLQLDNAEKREDSVKDIGALLDWIGRQPELDASRVAVSGGSYGGFMVLSSLTRFGSRIKAGIDIVGICNFNTFLANTSPYRVDLRRAEYGDERDAKMRAVFEQISPANHAERIVSALLVAHGRNDPRVPFSEAEQIAAKVRGQGRTVWTVYADNEGHGFQKKDNRDYLQAVEAFFLKQSLGIP